jgi:hypothetical protein
MMNKRASSTAFRQEADAWVFRYLQVTRERRLCLAASDVLLTTRRQRTVLTGDWLRHVEPKEERSLALWSVVGVDATVCNGNWN